VASSLIISSGLAITCGRVTSAAGQSSKFYAWTVQLFPNDCFSFNIFTSDTFHILPASMGIQGLARRLEPYSTRYSAQQLVGYTAIIDGPGLAYEAHKLGLSTAASQLRIPSYADMNNEAIKWLNSLEDQGITV
jgi:hypothetical protein